MTTAPLALLRTAETYLAATHEHAARHDNLGADYTCGGCQLRERIAAALAEASVTADPCHPCGCPRRFNRHADGCPIRDRIAQALEEADYRMDMRRGDLADAIMPVLPAFADRATIYRQLADEQERTATTDVIRRRRNIATARRLFAVELRRTADEEQS
ncbi:hypothetical protein [Streptomyces sp. BH105]|uniref:hypothetical protein n=1 Tax=Streptomyces sp. BH105 TaxID=3410408 RepID=UPI003CF8ECB3